MPAILVSLPSESFSFFSPGWSPGLLLCLLALSSVWPALSLALMILLAGPALPHCDLNSPSDLIDPKVYKSAAACTGENETEV